MIFGQFFIEKDNKEVFRTKHQHLATSFCQIRLAEQRNLINQNKIKQIQVLKEQGII